AIKGDTGRLHAEGGGDLRGGLEVRRIENPAQTERTVCRADVLRAGRRERSGLTQQSQEGLERALVRDDGDDQMVTRPGDRHVQQAPRLLPRLLLLDFSDGLESPGARGH